MMRTTIRFTNPEKLDATMVVTMTVANWKELQKLLSELDGSSRNTWPLSKFLDAISTTISEAERVIFHSEERPA